MQFRGLSALRLPCAWMASQSITCEKEKNKMAQIAFKGICSGTTTKISTKTGKPYSITTFVELPSLKRFEVFGDLKLAAHEDAREYNITADIVQLGNVVIQPLAAKK